MKVMRLISVGGVLPEKTVTNEDMTSLVDTSDEWIRSRTGIAERHFCDGDENVTSLAISAAKKALDRSGISPSDIGVIVCATVTSQYLTPSTACLLQMELELPENIPALDINAACTGFMYGVEVARGLLSNLGGRYALIVGCEQLSRVVDMEDRNTCVLFGDGAGAGVFELIDSDSTGDFGGSESVCYASTLGARGSLVLTGPGTGVSDSHLWMDGTAVFRFAVETIPKCINEVLEKSRLSLSDIDHVVCHQANKRIIDHVIKKLKAPKEKFFVNLDKTGNTSAASIPLALNDMYEENRLKPGDKLLCVGFGGGLTWAGVLLEYSPMARNT